MSAKQQKTEPKVESEARASSPQASASAGARASAGATTSTMPPSKKVRVSTSDGRQVRNEVVNIYLVIWK